jgi:hypothetical protein
VHNCDTVVVANTIQALPNVKILVRLFSAAAATEAQALCSSLARRTPLFLQKCRDKEKC